MKLSTEEHELASIYIKDLLDYNNMLCVMIKNSIRMDDGEIQAFAFKGELGGPAGDFSAGLGYGYGTLDHNTLGSRIFSMAAQHEPCI